MLGTKTNILLVEDNPFEAKLTIKELERHNLGESLAHVTNGNSALNYIYCREEFSNYTNACNHPSLILLDLNLPKIGGLDVLKELKSNHLTRHIPIVILVGTDYDPNIERGFAMGADGYIVKPLEFKKIADLLIKLGLCWMLNRSVANLPA